jgi:uncharacterized protein YndB with AHSA1/START domain
MQLILVLLISFSFISFAQEQTKPVVKYDVFSFDKEVTLPGTPEIIFDAVTGDINGWWDHSISENPKKFYIEPKPGGGFWEIFDDEGNGVLHATVIAANRGKLLRFDGPLGLAGTAIKIVTTYTFEPVGNDSTIFKVSIHAAGEVDEGIPAIVESVWDHFIFDQLKPYIEAGKHLQK